MAAEAEARKKAEERKRQAEEEERAAAKQKAAAEAKAREEAAARKEKEEKEAEAIAKQIIKASPSASLTQKEIQPQIIKASPSASLTQKEIQPQIIKASPSASLTQKEIQPQIIQATPSASLTLKEIQTPSNKSINNPELSITASIELAKDIIKLLKKKEIPIIYAYYLYLKHKAINKIKEDILVSEYKQYQNICDAINRLMLYLTDTAKDIKVDNYTDETQCNEYNIYFETLVFTNEILDGITKDTNKQELTKKYIRALYKELPTVFENVKDKSKLTNLLKTQGGDNNYKTAIDNIFNYTESSDESDILYDSDISEESIISIRSDYSEDLITPLLAPQT